MAASLHRQPGCVVTALLVPVLSRAGRLKPRIDGVPPAWAVLWLLPWALVDGPVSGAVADRSDIVMDGLSLDGASQFPALLLLGWWWGAWADVPLRFGTLNLGLLAWIGSLTVGLSLLLQLVIQGWSLDLDERLGWRTCSVGLPRRCWRRCWSRCSCCCGASKHVMNGPVTRQELCSAPLPLVWPPAVGAFQRDELNLWTSMAPEFNPYLDDVLTAWRQRQPQLPCVG